MNLEGIHCTIQQLMTRQHKLILQNNVITVKRYSELKVIQQSHSTTGDRQDSFICEASKFYVIKVISSLKNNINAFLVFHKVFNDQNIIFRHENQQLQYLNKNETIYVHGMSSRLI